MKHLVIIGNGITAVTIARHVRKQSDMAITLISAETDYFYSRTALMYIFMGHMTFKDTQPYEDWFWHKNRLALIKGFVSKIDIGRKELALQDGKVISYDILVVATGSKSNRFGWKGEDLTGVQGLYAYQDLDLLEENLKNVSRAVLVGGGLIGIELAEMLLSRKIKVTFLIREKYFWDIVLPEEEAKLISRHMVAHGIDLRQETQLKEILPGKNERVAAVMTMDDEKIDCQFVGLTIGVSPRIDVVKDSGIETGRGVLVNDFLETNIDNVYAAGDCAEIITAGEERNRIEQLWYTGRMQGEALARTICGNRTRYNRGTWFNSAKFLDIEYQTYGTVRIVPAEDEKSFYWQDEAKEKCLRINYKSNSGAVTGFNIFGSRLKQKVCQNWIERNLGIREVLQQLSDAFFDPEFFPDYHSRIIDAYNLDHQDQPIALPRKRFFRQKSA